MAAKIQKDAVRKANPTLYKENAILVRSAMQIRDIEGELIRRRIPYVVRGGRGLLQTEEVRESSSLSATRIKPQRFRGVHALLFCPALWRR